MNVDADENERAALKAALDALARARADLLEKQRVLDDLRAELVPYERAVRDARDRERAAYDIAASAALAARDATGESKPDVDVTVAATQRADILDEAGFIGWAIQNNRLDLLKIEIRQDRVTKALRAGELETAPAALQVVFQARIAENLNHRLLSQASETQE